MDDNCNTVYTDDYQRGKPSLKDGYNSFLTGDVPQQKIPARGKGDDSFYAKTEPKGSLIKGGQNGEQRN